MPDLRLATFTVLAVVLIAATSYSILYSTYLDTSNPLLAHLPHPLSKTHYFANKSNVLNVYFIKKAWAWTSAVFFLSWLSSPPDTRSFERVGKWLAETTMWLVFTAWFFGPSIIERAIIASGGECVLALPSGDPIAVPAEYCFAKTHLSPASHPHVFTTVSGLTTLPSNDWRALPRLRRGHDISGHIFLLTMSTLFLADQLRYSLRLSRRTIIHALAALVNGALVGVWLFATFTTGLYFHSPLEKLTGFILGTSCFVITLLPEVEAQERTKKAEKTGKIKHTKSL